MCARSKCSVVSANTPIGQCSEKCAIHVDSITSNATYGRGYQECLKQIEDSEWEYKSNTIIYNNTNVNDNNTDILHNKFNTIYNTSNEPRYNYNPNSGCGELAACLSNDNTTIRCYNYTQFGCCSDGNLYIQPTYINVMPNYPIRQCAHDHHNNPTS